ncbi:MAG: PadR family transcriptional regulator [Crenarchaeota archaeon]|nr:PadR family transcriptional regulator [Thermoproteota archaeon]
MKNIQLKPLKRLMKKLTIENLWIYVLKYMLIKKEPVKAYEVVRYVKKTLPYKPATVTVYTVIYRLAHEGLIDTVKIGGETLYQINNLGKKAFSEAITVFHQILDLLEKDV